MFRSRRLLAGALILAVLYALPTTSAFWAEWNRVRGSEDGVMTEGVVVRRSSVVLKGGAERAILYIRVAGRPETFRAILMANGEYDLPDTVSFYFPGDPKAEIQLNEEIDPFLSLLLMTLLSGVCLGYAGVLVRRDLREACAP